MSDDEFIHTFIGHTSELDFFQQWLVSTDPQKPSILFYHDAFTDPKKQGGIGKTWLLHKFAQLATEHGDVVVIIDFFNYQDRNAVEIARRVSDSVQQMYPDWHPANFDLALTNYKKPEQDASLLSSLQRTLGDAQSSDLAELPKRFTDTNKHIIVFCDTYERVEKHPSQLSLTPERQFPDTYGFQNISFVIAGRNRPDWESENWRTRRQMVRSAPVQPFTLEEMVLFIKEYITSNLSLSPENARDLYLRTEGRPILVGLVVDLLNSRQGPGAEQNIGAKLKLEQLLQMPSEKAEQYLVEQITAMGSSTDWVVIVMAHIFHRFNKQILKLLFQSYEALDEVHQDEAVEEVWEKLKTLSFVRRPATGGDIALHDEMRQLVLRFSWAKQWKPEPIVPQRRELSQKIIPYYVGMIAREQDVQAHQAYQVEMLYHQLWVDKATGFASFMEQTQQALTLRQNAQVRSLLQQVEEFEADLQLERLRTSDRSREATTLQQEMDEFTRGLSSDQQKDLQVREAKLLQNEEHYEEAQTLYKDLLKQGRSSWLEEHRASLNYEVGDCLIHLSQFQDAIYALTRSLEIHHAQKNLRGVALIYGRIGHAYFKQGNFAIAVGYYKESIELHRSNDNLIGHADIINSLGVVYAELGKLDEALLNCQIALLKRQELRKKGRVGDVSVAISLRFVGVVHYKRNEFVLALTYLQRAYEIYERSAYRQGIAATCIYLGQIALDTGELEKAGNYFKKAHQAALHIDAEDEIRSLNKQGLVLQKEGRTDEAITFFQDAIARAHDVHDLYQEVESLIDLATIQLEAGSYEEGQHIFQKAEDLALDHHYFVLLGRIAKVQVDTCHKRGDYQGEARHYTEYCFYLASYNLEKYQNAVIQVMEFLIALPESMMGLIWQQLYNDWSIVELDADQHLFMEKKLEEVKSFMSL